MTKSARQIQRQRIADSSLQAKTLLYWQIGLARIGKGPLYNCSIEAALGLLTDLELSTSWETPLGKQVSDMLNAVIGKPKKVRPKHNKPPRRDSKSLGIYDSDDWDGPSAA